MLKSEEEFPRKAHISIIIDNGQDDINIFFHIAIL